MRLSLSSLVVTAAAPVAAALFASVLVAAPAAPAPATVAPAAAVQPAAATPAAKPQVIELWPAGKVPGEKPGALGPEKRTEKNGVVTSITDVSVPSIEVHLPPKDKATGVAIVIAPGGGYKNLAWDHEGEQIAAWANSRGIAGVVLKYRVPKRLDQPQDQPPVGALQDAQRAMGLVRANAAAWGVDAKKVGLLGFSAGGHLTVWAGTNFDKRAYDAVDDADKLSSRPDFAVSIYGGGFVDPATMELKPEARVSKETVKDLPPFFLAHATNDKSENSVALYLALKKAGASPEMHLYAKGGHGFGIRPTAGDAATWPARLEEWMTTIGVLPGGGEPAKPTAAAAAAK
jgi:acetyl esterase/lipase